MHYYEKGFDSKIKTDGSPVTEADYASSQLILEILKETNIPVLGEESVHESYEIRKNWKLNWCVDPLDGTKEYIQRNGEFAVNIALIDEGKAIFGVIAWPVEQKVLFGSKEIGVYISLFEDVNDVCKWKKIEAKTQYNSPLIMATSRSPHSGASADFIEELKVKHSEIEFLKKGSALKFFDLVTGTADVYPRFTPTMEWDIAAGQAILEALGGVIYDVETGNSLIYNKESLFNPFFIAKTKPLLSILFCFCFLLSWSQQNFAPIHSYFKDKIYSPLKGKSFLNGSFFPVSENEFDLQTLNADTSIQYYDFTEMLLKNYLIQVKGENYNFSITPLMDISKGENRADTVPTKYYQNTRGLQIEGDLFKNFSYSTAFYENQARFLDYERAYYNSIGELYPNNGGYSTLNAVIPGAARTKPFKENGYDYAYAIGSIVYSPIKKIQIAVGNNSHFIGAGHRSLLLSDNSINGPYFQINYNLSKRFSIVCMREKMFNLLRRPIKTTDEAYYEPKGYSVNYATFKPFDFFSISAFEGIIWSKGDSVTSHKVNNFFYNPIPGLTEALYSNYNQMNSILGLNIEGVLLKNYRVYSQIAMSNLNSKHFGFQFGIRGYNFFKIKNLMLQLEYNDVPNSLYVATVNRRLNYSQCNLPLAHTKGNGFQEFIIRFNYEYKRFYIDYKTIMYQLRNYEANFLLAVSKNNPIQNKQIYHHQIEAGYRINRKINFTVFATWVQRVDFNSDNFKTNFLNFGLRTGIINHYNDF